VARDQRPPEPTPADTRLRCTQGCATAPPADYMARASACPVWPSCDPTFLACLAAAEAMPDSAVLAALDAAAAAEAER
jgi:hypothetical protein